MATKVKHGISRITACHYGKLFYRGALLLAALAMYILGKLCPGDGGDFFGVAHEQWLLALILLVYMLEMALRLFPSRLDSPGCQKQFHFIPTGEQKPKLVSWKRTFLVALAWFGLNGAIGGAYLLGLLDKGSLVLVSLAYGVCDMICILFFCPFQSWFLKNRCCADCRIYNWDFPMMFTPLVFLPPSWFTTPLVILALIILVRWELTLRLRPERFARNTNGYISCANCREKLCLHKRQLRGYWKKNNIR